jgi:hypothetical protein
MMFTEPTAQQDETPQPPPKPDAGATVSLPPAPQLKEDMTFFTFFDPQVLHLVEFSSWKILRRRENFLLQSWHIYS